MDSLAILRQLATERPTEAAVDIRGTVWHADRNRILLWDGAEIDELHIDDEGRTLRAGDKLRLRGRARIRHVRGGLEVLRLPVVDNDGLHVHQEKSSSIPLDAGWTPIRIDWFNAGGKRSLTLEYEGPGLGRQAVAESVLRPESTTSNARGLTYRSFNGRWWALPQNFDPRDVTTTGIAPRLDVALAPRTDRSALQFTGSLLIPVAGTYTFYLGSDDGSRIFIGPPSLVLETLGHEPLPAPRFVSPGQIVPADHRYFRATMEGRVTAVASQARRLLLRLEAGSGTAQIELSVDEHQMSSLLNNARVRVTGVCHADLAPDRTSLAGVLLAQASEGLEVLEVAPEQWLRLPTISVAEAVRHSLLDQSKREPMVHLRGTIVSVSSGSFVLKDDSGAAQIQSRSNLAPTIGAAVEVLAYKEATSAALPVLTHTQVRPIFTAEAPLPLATVEQIHQLGQTDLARNPAVKIAAVVTCSLPERQAVVLQDATRGIYVSLNSIPMTVEIGDFLELEGEARAGEFSPFVRGLRAHRVGTGQFPTPIVAAREQLLDGSLHCQWVEAEGYVSDVVDDRVTLLMRGGLVKIRLEDCPAVTLREMPGTIVRIRGCLFSAWDAQTRRVRVGAITFNNTRVVFEKRAVVDLFSGPKKNAAELLRFDPNANFFQRIRISGQVLHAAGRLLFLDDQGEGLRVRLASETPVAVGELVEAAGFATFDGPSPLIAEAAIRKLGSAPLPPPRLLTGNLISDGHDAQRVALRGVVVGTSSDRDAQGLEVESERIRFQARVTAAGASLPLVGSTVELTGVYSSQGGNRALGQAIEGFELLVGSAADIRVVARPPWWTLRRLLLFLGVLALGLLATLVWVRSLRRQVSEQTSRLKREIEERQQAEQQRALEQERTRLANDLHDDLGSRLTELSMLGALAGTARIAEENKTRYLGDLTERTRNLVDVLDEIVWAINPKYDTVDSLPAYYSAYAQRFLALANIRCRLDIPEDLPATPLGSTVRHSLFLALKETLNNVTRHAHASEVLFRMRVTTFGLLVSIADDGGGITQTELAPGRDGLASIRIRLQSLGGSAEISSMPGKGTTVTLKVPLS